MSDQHKISFLDGEKLSDAPKKEDVKPERTIQQLADAQKAKNMLDKREDDKKNDLMSNHTITSARTGVIKDDGGPSKYIKSETSNTVWDSERTARMTEDSKTKTTKAKRAIADNKRHAEEKRMNDLVEVLKTTDQTKASAVSPTGTFSGSSYKASAGSMSIFDTKDFERLPEKTAGEKVTEDNNARKGQKDDSWRGGGKSITTSELVSEYFNKLLQKRDQ